MRVIVTRPPTSAARTAEKLTHLGHEPVLLPVSVPVHDPDAAADALALAHAALAITSAEAVRVLTDLDLSAHRDTPVFTVGETTAEAARQAGFRHVEAGPGDGEHLARLLAERGAEDILYLAGSPRAPGFEAGLRTAGLHFRTADVYAMRAVDWTEEQRASLHPFPDAVLLYSRETARRFFQRALPLLPEGSGRLFHVLCLSPQIAADVPQKDTIALHVADHPKEDELLLLLSSCAGTKIG
ncbi:uroporphyrinogen-III synthase [Rhizobium sp. SL86]|uniref:uroporphyrinogen-III synthase n=1 Tax=Rhizobium sp. SL86 TaxID=2995148 RepID=UPI002274D37D|nr:uroporphyrinogen-III synthase [Rhizobium sp. SL86]MCY1665674.1 uroporphyrinogen-III synthase [Rhizobium sp. SL86]